MKDSNFDTTASLVLQDFQIEAEQDVLSEEELLKILADHIAWLIDHRLDFLLSLMYRLDITEAKINAALSPANPFPAHLALAHLVLERQKERVQTKQLYDTKSEDIEDGLKW